MCLGDSFVGSFFGFGVDGVVLSLSFRLDFSDFLKSILVNYKFLLSDFFNVSNSLFNCSLFLFLGSFFDSLGNGVRLFSGFSFIYFLHVWSNVLGGLGFLGSNGDLECGGGSSLNRFLSSIIKSLFFISLSNGHSFSVGD